MADVTLPAAFVAGLASFASPCVLPLVPPYLCYLAGTSLDQITHQAPTNAAARRTLGAALLFVAGFSTVFVALGAGASVVGGYLRLYSQELAIIAGISILLMGLHFLGLLRFDWLTRTKRVHVDAPVGMAGAYIMGLAFAFGWTPCIGPVLAAILAVAASEQTLAHGAGLLAIYSAGLGVPFLLVAAMARPALGLLGRARRWLPAVEKGMGALLVLTGIGFLSGWIATASYWLLETFPLLAKLG
ncbi:MAG: cytochrome c biosis protein transrane region [Xanthobacteraceae bacterium]|nr:cytochrome c biosis protein transrane region [Xanthobacteraceae bacterium]